MDSFSAFLKTVFGGSHGIGANLLDAPKGAAKETGFGVLKNAIEIGGEFFGRGHRRDSPKPVGGELLRLVPDQSGKLKRVGQILGTVVIIVSLLALVCPLTYKIRKGGWYGHGASGKTLCPFAAKAYRTNALPQP